MVILPKISNNETVKKDSKKLYELSVQTIKEKLNCKDKNESL